jgi:ribonuclease P protein component
MRFRTTALPTFLVTVMPSHGTEGADHVLIGRLPAKDRDWAQLGADLTRALAKTRK